VVLLLAVGSGTPHPDIRGIEREATFAVPRASITLFWPQNDSEKTIKRWKVQDVALGYFSFAQGDEAESFAVPVFLNPMTGSITIDSAATHLSVIKADNIIGDPGSDSGVIKIADYSLV